MAHHIALMGKARSGKDTIAARLVEAHHYTRLAFADALKTAALQVDPIVSYEPAGVAHIPTRLSDVVRRFGWDRAKEQIPEVRRLLQHMGQGVRNIDQDFWLREVLSQVEQAERWNMPVVVSDVRYLNEAHRLKAAGFTLVRVVRPGRVDTVGAEEMRARRHASETELDHHTSDVTMVNDGSLSQLSSLVDQLMA